MTTDSIPLVRTFFGAGASCAELLAAQSQDIQSLPMDNAAQHQSSGNHQSDIIGTKEFEFDANCLDEYLEDILKWWNGDRKPRGVSLEQSGRCLYVHLFLIQNSLSMDLNII